MAELTAEQQIAERDKDRALREAEIAATNQTAMAQAEITNRADMVKVAHTVLMENARSKPVSERDVTADAIKAYADTLATYIKTGA